MAEALVSFVHERLAELMTLEEKVKFSGGGIGIAIEDAQKTLDSIRLFLKNADAKQGDDELRKRVAEIREAACDLEDVIESHVSKEANSKKKARGMKVLAKGFACVGAADLGKIVSEIKRINTKISDLRGELQKFGITQIKENNGGSTYFGRRNRMLRRTYSPVRKQNVVGLVKDVRQLVRHLLAEDQKSSHRVVSIWGMGGLGKTTIAQEVYHNEMVRKHFERFAWVCVCISTRCKQTCFGRNFD